MAKLSGVEFVTLSVDDAGGTPRDLRNDITNFDFATPREVQDVTGLDKPAMERILLLGDFSITLNGVFNPATNKSHDVFKTISSTSVARTVLIAHGGASLSNETLFTDYKITRDNSGSMPWEAPGVLADGTVPTWA